MQVNFNNAFIQDYKIHNAFIKDYSIPIRDQVRLVKKKSQTGFLISYIYATFLLKRK